jgi:hypothetical protein
MNPTSSVLSRLLLSLVLLLGLTKPVAAASWAPHESRRVTAARPLLGEWFEGVKVGGTTSRRSVVRITALCMALALFIMYRSKH